MKPFVSALLALAAALTSLSHGLALAQHPNSQSTQRPAVPVIPAGIAESERSALTHAALAISRGLFEQAAAQIRPMIPPATVQVFVDWAPVPPAQRAAYVQSLEHAVHAWNTGLGGSIRFETAAQEDSADLRIFFEKGVASVMNGQARILAADYTPQPGPRRSGRARIALEIPYSDAPEPPSAIERLFAHALTGYLGLKAPDPLDGMMGATNAGPSPSPSEIELARSLQDARAKLLDFASRRVAAYLPRPVLSIETPEIDAGDVERGDAAHFVFRLKNSGDAPLEVDAKPNCGCTVATFDKVIAPGAEGKVEADFHSVGYRGKVEKLISITSNDPENASTRLKLVCNVVSELTVLPSETAIVSLKSEGPTVKEFEIKTSGRSPVEVTRVTCRAPYADAKLEPAQSADGGKSYKLTVTIKPEAPIGHSAFMITAFTSSPREPQVNITAICDKGILAVPMSLYLGTIEPSTALPITQLVTIMKSDGEFHIKRISVDDPRLDVRQGIAGEGSKYRLTVRYKGGWPAGAARARITIDTDDAAQPRIEIPVMASVLAAAPSR